MKSILKNKHFILGAVFFMCFLLVALSGFSQKKSVIQDPQLGKIGFFDNTGNQVNENYLQPQQVIRLRIPVALVNHDKQLPAGSCKIKIGFGSKLILDPSYDLNTTTLGNYFKWTSSANDGQELITGELMNPLPADFEHVDVAFKVLGTAEGISTITANFLITNHNTQTILSDEDGTNNSSFIQYRVTTQAAPTPVTTINDFAKSGCAVDVTFSTDKEINLSGYEVEVSKDAVNYIKAGSVAANNQTAYVFSLNLAQDMQAKVLYVRIKSIDKTGRVTYSTAKATDATCDGKWKLDIYPNPASNVKSVVIRSVDGALKGKYVVSMVEMSGKTIHVKEIQVNGGNSFNYEFGNIASGKYFIKIASADGSQSTLLTFEKL